MQSIIGLLLATILTLTSAQQPNNQRRESMKSPFSIGLGVLSPSYSQQIGSSGSLDVMHNDDNSGFSYALNNVAHPSSSVAGRIVNDERVSYGPQYQFKSSISSQASGSKQTSDPIVSIYHTQTPSNSPSNSESYAPLSYRESSEDDGSYKPVIPETRVQPSRQYEQPAARQYDQPSRQYEPSGQYEQPSRQYEQPAIRQYEQPSRQFDGNTQHRQYFQLEQNTGNIQSLQSYQQPQRQKFEVSQPGIFSVQNYEQPRSDGQRYQLRGPLSSSPSEDEGSQSYEQPKTFNSYASNRQQSNQQYSPFSDYTPFQPFQPQNYDQPKNVESVSSAQPQSIEIPKASYSPQQSYDLTKSLFSDSVEPQPASYQPSPQRQSYQPITFQSSPDRVNLQPLIPEKYLSNFSAVPQANAARDQSSVNNGRYSSANDGRYGNFDFRQQVSHQSPQTFQHSFTY